jgi:hypothetical protein
MTITYPIVPIHAFTYQSQVVQHNTYIMLNNTKLWILYLNLPKKPKYILMFQTL